MQNSDSCLAWKKMQDHRINIFFHRKYLHSSLLRKSSYAEYQQVTILVLVMLCEEIPACELDCLADLIHWQDLRQHLRIVPRDNISMVTIFITNMVQLSG